MRTDVNSLISFDFFTDLCNSITMDDKKGSNYIPTTKYKPSGMQCIRNMYFYMTETPLDEPDNPYFMRGIQFAGTDIHARIEATIQGMKENGFDCEYVSVADYIKEHNLDYLNVVGEAGSETKVYDTRYNMIFLCDGIIKYKGTYYIIEFKTKGVKKWDKITAVEDCHKDQATAYSLAFGIDQVMFVYINRDWLGLKTFLIDITPEMREGLVKKIKDCDDYVAKRELPPRPTGMDCQYCPYKSKCHN